MDNKQKNKNSAAKIKANNKWIQTNYKRMQISTTPEQADYIRETAKKYNITIVQLILDSIKYYEKVAGADPAQPEIVTAESSMESGETTGARPEEETEETTEEENQTAGAETTAGAEEEPQEDEDEKPEEIPSFVWEQIQRLKKADKRHTAERKAREAAERKRRRLGEENAEDY